VNVGGDIAGLRRLARTLSGVVGDIQGSGEFLSKRVDQLVGDAGWSGAAAEEFRGAWEQDATAVVELSSCVKLAGTALAALASGLAAAQHRLDRAVSAAQDAGVPVMADGVVPPGVYPEPVLAAMRQYSTESAAALRDAQDARTRRRRCCTTSSRRSPANRRRSSSPPMRRSWPRR
jgi:uncharacterized protein YukE